MTGGGAAPGRVVPLALPRARRKTSVLRRDRPSVVSTAQGCADTSQFAGLSLRLHRLCFFAGRLFTHGALSQGIGLPPWLPGPSSVGRVGLDGRSPTPVAMRLSSQLSVVVPRPVKNANLLQRHELQGEKKVTYRRCSSPRFRRIDAGLTETPHATTERSAD